MKIKGYERVDVATAKKYREELQKRYIGYAFPDIPERLHPGLVGAVVQYLNTERGFTYSEDAKFVVYNEMMWPEDDPDDETYELVGVSDIPPLMLMDEYKRSRGAFNPFLNWLSTPIPTFYSTGFIFTGEFLMEEFGDDLNSVISCIDEMFSSDLTSEESEAIIRIPEGCKAFSDIFGWEPEFGDFPVHVFSDPDAPELTPYWTWPKAETEAALVAVENNENCKAIGPPGTGKSEFWKNIAAVTGRPFIRINMSMSVELDTLIGAKELLVGEGNAPITRFIKGELPKVLETPAVILFDEVSRASAPVYMATLQTLLEPDRMLKIQETGEKIYAHPHCILAGADNTLGLGDDLDKFPTANTQDVSTLNRWNNTLHIGYILPEKLCELILQHAPRLHRNQAEKIAKLASLCQDAYRTGQIPLTFSPRQAIPIAKKAVVFKDMRRAIEVTYTNSMDEQSRAIVNGFIQTIWK